MSKKPIRLYKQPEPVVIDRRILVLMSFLFFVLAFLLGSAMRHYPSVSGVI